MTLRDLQKPKNHRELIGKPMLFAVMPTAMLKEGGEARIQYNILNGTYHVSGQKNSPVPYAMPNISQAIKLAKRINHYNETGERILPKTGKVDELVLVD